VPLGRASARSQTICDQRSTGPSEITPRTCWHLFREAELDHSKSGVTVLVVVRRGKIEISQSHGILRFRIVPTLKALVNNVRGALRRLVCTQGGSCLMLRAHGPSQIDRHVCQSSYCFSLRTISPHSPGGRHVSPPVRNQQIGGSSSSSPLRGAIIQGTLPAQPDLRMATSVFPRIA
jgi:hypothetical protein